jgi:hypothetical protein
LPEANAVSRSIGLIAHRDWDLQQLGPDPMKNNKAQQASDQQSGPTRLTSGQRQQAPKPPAEQQLQGG